MTRRRSEADFQQQVLDLARLYGWRCYHTFDSRRSAPGFPDLVLVRPPDLIFAELKTDTGRLSAEQTAWLNDLRQVAEHVGYVALDVVVWRPADFDEINARLALPRARRAA